MPPKKEQLDLVLPGDGAVTTADSARYGTTEDGDDDEEFALHNSPMSIDNPKHGAENDGDSDEDSHEDSHNGSFKSHGSIQSDNPNDTLSMQESSHESTPAYVNRKKTIATKETRTLRGIKLVVAVLLVCISAVLAGGVYFYTSKTEQDQFDDQFKEYSNKIFEDVGETLDETLKALDLLATQIASIAEETPTVNPHPWPRITIPSFGTSTAKTIALSKIQALVMCVVVNRDNRQDWETYTEEKGRGWVDATVDVQETDPNYYGPINRQYFTNSHVHGEYQHTRPNETETMFVSWQAYPVVPQWPPYNFDYLTLNYTDAHRRMIESGKIEITEPYMLPDEDKPWEVAAAEGWADFYRDRIPPNEDPLAPASEIYFPVFNSTGTVKAKADLKPVAGFAASFYWRDLFRSIIPDGAADMVLVTSNPCAPSFTYIIVGSRVQWVGRGDHHDTKFNEMAVSTPIGDLHTFRTNASIPTTPDFDGDFCPNTFTVYPTQQMEDRYLTNNPIIFTVVAIVICLVTSITFMLYDFFVEVRQRAVVRTAEKSNAVVSSLFPEGVRERIYNEADTGKHDVKPNKMVALASAVMNGSNDPFSAFPGIPDDKPIAQLYTATTVMFADIVGFTSWSSTRQPEAVFTLLETIYGVFDKKARKRGVFKVETIGDCYVAVCGLPKPSLNHASTMVRFAMDCRTAMNSLMKDLVGSLGPSTADLKMRFGMNSGPTTAGVLRGDRSRFQLFGDTVNTAARMESTGTPDYIQISQSTADLLIDEGKHGWIVPRQDTIIAKGKGRVKTFWVDTSSEISSSASAGNRSGLISDSSSTTSEKTGSRRKRKSIQPDKTSRVDRLAAWNIDMLETILRRVIAYNETVLSTRSSGNSNGSMHDQTKARSSTKPWAHRGSSQPRQELCEAVNFDVNTDKSTTFPSIDTDSLPPLPANLKDELKELVISVACLHKAGNPFHNFQHATQVVMANRKLFSRLAEETSATGTPNHIARILRSDPTIQFAAIFSALVHDLDHPGVPNQVLVKEQSRLAMLYDDKSVAEQNSLTMGWDLLTSSRFTNIQKCLFVNDERKALFRNILVHAVMATDIFDKELQMCRTERWQIQFGDDEQDAKTLQAATTSILEHMIQASDISHTMQHWTIFEKWNRNLFREMENNHKSGRTDKDPAEGWYQGELWFFDNYVIPLVEKMKACGVFDERWCDEALKFAKQNRSEWETRGQMIIKRWLDDDRRGSNIKRGGSVGSCCNNSTASSRSTHDHNTVDESCEMDSHIV